MTKISIQLPHTIHMINILALSKPEKHIHLSLSWWRKNVNRSIKKTRIKLSMKNHASFHMIYTTEIPRYKKALTSNHPPVLRRCWPPTWSSTSCIFVDDTRSWCGLHLWKKEKRERHFSFSSLPLPDIVVIENDISDGITTEKLGGYSMRDTRK